MERRSVKRSISVRLLVKLVVPLLLSVAFLIWLLPTPPGQQEESDYVGSAKCLSCHAESHPGLTARWQTSRHHLSMQSATHASCALSNRMRGLPLPTGAFSVIGDPNGPHVIISSDLSVMASSQWDPEETDPPHDRIGVPGQTIDAARECLGCHTTGYYASRRTFSEPAVGCEACHGPGKHHAANPDDPNAIVNPARLSPIRRRMVCGACHSLGKDASGVFPFPVARDAGHLTPYRPGTDLAAVFVDAKPVIVGKGWEYSLLIQSAPAYARQLCTDCHDPHGRDNPAMLIDATSEICLRCHAKTQSARLAYENHWGLGNCVKTPCWKCHRNSHQH